MPHPCNRRRSGGFLPGRLLAVLALVLAAACQRDPAPAEPYPSLATVPPRPQLGYDVEQGRAIEAGLVRDRENAAYLEAVLEHDLGRAGPPPPPPAPLEAAAPAAPPSAPAEGERRRGPGDDPAVESYVADALARDKDDGELNDFLRKLERPVPGAGTGASLARAVGLGGGQPADRPRSAALDHFGEHLGGALGVEPAGAGTILARITFAPGSPALPPDQDAALARALETAREAGAVLRIAGGGVDGDLPLVRVRAVAIALRGLGAEPERLQLAPGGGSEAVEVVLATAPDA